MIHRTFCSVNLSEAQTLQRNGSLKGTITTTTHSASHKRTEGNWCRKAIFNVTARLLTSHGCLGELRLLWEAFCSAWGETSSSPLTFSLAVREFWTCVDVESSNEFFISFKIRIPSVKGDATPEIKSMPSHIQAFR